MTYLSLMLALTVATGSAQASDESGRFYESEKTVSVLTVGRGLVSRSAASF